MDNWVGLGPRPWIVISLLTEMPVLITNIDQARLQMPLHFQASPKKKNRVKIQMLICPMEFLPNFAFVFAHFLWDHINYLFMKTHPSGSNSSSYVLFNYMWKAWATLTTLLMAFNWMNEADSARKMRPAVPLLEAYGKTIVATSVFCFLIDLYMFVSMALLVGTPPAAPSVSSIGFIYFPLLGFICAIFFQYNAMKVAQLLSSNGASTNDALRTFRTKMIRNLAKGGTIDIGGFFVTMIFSTFATNNKNTYGMFWNVCMQRHLISYFQLLSIEPAAVAKVREKRTKTMKSFKSSFGSSVGSMSSSSHLSSHGSSTGTSVAASSASSVSYDGSAAGSATNLSASSSDSRRPSTKDERRTSRGFSLSGLFSGGKESVRRTSEYLEDKWRRSSERRASSMRPEARRGSDALDEKYDGDEL